MILKGLLHVISLPPRLLFALTIPNCNNEGLRKWYPVAFVMCKLWIAVLAFFVSWTITVIGKEYLNLFISNFRGKNIIQT